MIKILFLPAYSKRTSLVQFTEEVRAIQERLHLPGKKQKFTFFQSRALRIEDLRNAFEDIRPNIIHIIGHGSPDRKIYLQNKAGENVLINSKTLGSIFSLLKGDIRCVVLNGSTNPEQAQEIYRAVGCIVGVPSTLGEKLSIPFCSSFYRSLREGMNIQDAFTLASHEINVETLGNANTPLLLISPDITVESTYLEKPKGRKRTTAVGSTDFSTLDFGAPAAERDINKGLKDYFVESDTFRRVQSGAKFIILGNRCWQKKKRARGPSMVHMLLLGNILSTFWL